MICGLVLSIAASIHVNEHYTNSIHPGAGISCQGLKAGVYYNSLSRDSWYVGYEKALTKDLSVEAIAITGYEDDPVPMFRAKYKNFFAMPTNNGAVFGIQFDIGE